MEAATDSVSERQGRFARAGLWTVVAALIAAAGVSFIGRLVAAEVSTTEASEPRQTASDGGADAGLQANATDAAHGTFLSVDGSLSLTAASVQSRQAEPPHIDDAIDAGPSLGSRPEPSSGTGLSAARGERKATAKTAPTRLAPAGSSALPSVGIARERVTPPAVRSMLDYGLDADVGISGILPDAGVLLALRAARWLHVQGGVGHNGIALGVRGGVTIVNPFAPPLSLTCEGGHYFEGDANKVVRWFNTNVREVRSLRRFSYDYFNLLGGLELEGQHLSLYLRGGVTWMKTRVKDFAQSVQELGQVDLRASDPTVAYRGPTWKLGAYYFF
jgi:hypothetical protein